MSIVIIYISETRNFNIVMLDTLTTTQQSNVSHKFLGLTMNT